MDMPNNIPDVYQQLRTALTSWVDLPEPQWQALAAIFRIGTFESREHVQLPGDGAYELLFVSRGLLRFYYPDESGTESNKAFIAENGFAAPLASFSLDLSLPYGVQALEPTTLLSAGLSDFTSLFDHHHLFDRIGRRLAESLLIHKELRTRSLLQKSATERYLEFMRHHPSLVHRVPGYHIASYLGITDVSLSRIRRSLAEKVVLNKS